MQNIDFFVQTAYTIRINTKEDVFMASSTTTNISIYMDSDLKAQADVLIAAMLEAERIAKDPSVKGYNDLDELFTDLKA